MIIKHTYYTLGPNKVRYIITRRTIQVKVNGKFNVYLPNL